MVPAHGGRAAAPVYRPILASRRGELEALSHLDPAYAALVAPILEIGAIGRSTMDAIRRLPAGLLPAIDVSALPDIPEAELTRWGVPVVPVIGLSESDHRLVAHGAAARAYGRRALVRLRAGQDRAGPDASTTAVERIWRVHRPRPGGVRPAGGRGGRLLPGGRADRRAPGTPPAGLGAPTRLAVVTVAAGGMPPTLSRLPTDEPVQLDRWDWQLWRRWRRRCRTTATTASTRPGRAPVTAATGCHGALHRRRQLVGLPLGATRRPGDDRFADLCRTLVSAHHRPTSGRPSPGVYHELLRRAAGVPGPARPPTGGVEHLAPPGHVLGTLLHPAGEGARRTRPAKAPRRAPRQGPPQRGRSLR